MPKVKTTTPRIPIKWKLYSIGLIIILTFSIILYFFVLPLLKKDKIYEREQKLAAVVESAISLMQYYENGIRKNAYLKDPSLPATRTEAQKRVIRTVRQIRYDRTDHIFVLDGDANMVLHPLKPDLEGKNMSGVQSPNGGKPFLEMARRSQTDTKTFVRYHWLSKWSQSVHEPQTTYAQYFYPWDWVVCSSVYTQDIVDSVRESAFRASIYFSIGIIATIALIIALSRIIVQPVYRLSKKAEEIVHTFDSKELEAVDIKNNDEIGDLAENFNTMTLRLSESIGFLKNEIVERKKIENALRISEEKYRNVIENANDAIFIAQDGVIKFPNPTTIEMTGYSAQELASMPFTEIIHPGHKNMVLERYTARLAGKSAPNTYTFKIVNRDASTVWVQINSVLVEWEGKPAALNFIRDINEQKRLESKLIQAQKMESLGTLAGGIAHDFNNILMGIQGNVSLLLSDRDKGDLNLEKLESIEQYVNNASELTRQLLGLAKGGNYELEPTDLNELIDRSSKMFGRTKKEILIITDLQDDLWTAEVDRGQIEQAILNIFVNAWQAMPEGGELCISTQNTTFSKADLWASQQTPGKYVKISIVDTGTGMSQETKERIFDPFFSTKDKSRGTGLGLASAYGIIESHRGIINVDSDLGKGSTFTILLPASDKKPVVQEISNNTLQKGNEMILLVDDEEMIIDIGEQMLTRLGYSTVSAKSGKAAIEILKKDKDTIDLVILDMIMPNMSGSETYDMLKKINPGIKVILSSGYSESGQAAAMLEKGCNGFIQKPFSLNQFSEKIRQVLDS